MLCLRRVVGKLGLKIVDFSSRFFSVSVPFFHAKNGVKFGVLRLFSEKKYAGQLEASDLISYGANDNIRLVAKEPSGDWHLPSNLIKHSATIENTVSSIPQIDQALHVALGGALHVSDCNSTSLRSTVQSLHRQCKVLQQNVETLKSEMADLTMRAKLQKERINSMKPSIVVAEANNILKHVQNLVLDYVFGSEFPEHRSNVRHLGELVVILLNSDCDPRISQRMYDLDPQWKSNLRSFNAFARDVAIQHGGGHWQKKVDAVAFEKTLTEDYIDSVLMKITPECQMPHFQKKAVAMVHILRAGYRRLAPDVLELAVEPDEIAESTPMRADETVNWARVTV